MIALYIISGVAAYVVVAIVTTLYVRMCIRHELEYLFLFTMPYTFFLKILVDTGSDDTDAVMAGIFWPLLLIANIVCIPFVLVYYIVKFPFVVLYRLLERVAAKAG